jgi:hypothetical protein
VSRKYTCSAPKKVAIPRANVIISRNTGTTNICCHLNSEPLIRNKTKKIGTVGKNLPSDVRTAAMGRRSLGNEEFVISLPAPVIDAAPEVMQPATK